MKKTKREERLNLYFTSEEMEKIARNFGIEYPLEGQADSKKLASHIRDLALKKRIRVKTIDPIAIQQYNELSRLSSNLNQLSKSRNEGVEIEFSEVKSLLDQLRLKLIGIHEK